MKLDAAREGNVAASGTRSAPTSAPGGVDQIYMGTGGVAPKCPAGYTLSKTGNLRPSWYCNRTSSPLSYAPAPAPAPQAAPITVSPVITVSPNMQQSFSPQFSPVMQQSSGSGSQSASPEQSTSGGQTGTTAPSGISEREAALREQIAYMNAMEAARGNQPPIPVATPAPAPVVVPQPRDGAQGGGGPIYMPPPDEPVQAAPVPQMAPQESPLQNLTPYAIIGILAVGGILLMSNRNKGTRR
jgi:hypothetical protein